MKPLGRWAWRWSRGRFLLVLVATGAMTLWLNAASRSRVWAYEEAITPVAERQEQADLDHRVERAARAEYLRRYRRAVPDRMTAGLRDTLAGLEANGREAMTAALALRRAHLHRMAALLRAGELLSWILLAFLVYLAWSHAGRGADQPLD